MPAVYARRLDVPTRSFLVLGRRGSGKTTWLRARLPKARWCNLLLDRAQLRLMRDPHLFRQAIDALPSGTWVVLDEIQMLPALMNEITMRSPPRRGAGVSRCLSLCGVGNISQLSCRIACRT